MLSRKRRVSVFFWSLILGHSPGRYPFCCTFPILRSRKPLRHRDLGRWALPTTASCGARTFLSPVRRGAKARRRSRQRPSGRPANPFIVHARRPGGVPDTGSLLDKTALHREDNRRTG